MDDIVRQYSKLEIEFTELSTNFDEQKRMLNRSLKMLVGTLESDNPQSVENISLQKIETLAQAQSVVRELEKCYRGFTIQLVTGLRKNRGLFQRPISPYLRH